MVLIVVGAFGWGNALVYVPIRRARASSRTVDEFGVPQRVAFGLAAFLVAGGVAVAADGARLPFLVGWQVAGCALAAPALVNLARWRLRAWQAIGVTLSGALVALCAFGAALTGPFNANDDGPAYVYLAQRLLSTGGLIDPFNTRRLNSYGGAELFQALVLRFAGNSAALGVEWFLFAVLLAFLVMRSGRRPFAIPVLLIAGLGLVLVRPVGIWVNSAPTFSGAALTVALMHLLRGSRRGASEWWRFALGGMVLAAILSLRFEFFVAAAIPLIAIPLVVVRGRAGVVALGAGAAAFVAGTIGWAVALARSSGTPFFPLIAGNWTSASQWRDPAIHGLAGYLHRFALGAEQDHWPFAVVGSVVLVAGLWAIGRRTTWAQELERVNFEVGLIVLVSVAIGCVIELLAESVALTGALLTDIGRYSAPSALACLAFGLDLALEAAEAHSSSTAKRTDGGSVLASARGLYRGAVALACLGLWLGVLGVPLGFYGPAIRNATRAGVDLLSGRTHLTQHYVSQRNEYERLSARIPEHAKVLAAVDQPLLLDFSRYSFSTLDIVGGTSPAPHFPVYGGPTKIVGYLERLGFDGIVASSPRTRGLYNIDAASANVDSGIYNFRVSARETVAWANDLAQLTERYRSVLVKVGALEYIPLRTVPAP